MSGKFLGIDYGGSWIGLALSDAEGRVAFAHDVVRNSSQVVEAIAGVCTEHDVVGVVVGESKDFKGKDNAVMEEVNVFVDDLRHEMDLPVHLEPEFMTTLEANRLVEGRERKDAHAAALILQRYLDRKNAHRG